MNEWLAIEKYAEIEVATLDQGFPPRSSVAIPEEEKKKMKGDGWHGRGGGREGSHLVEEHNSTTKRLISI